MYGTILVPLDGSPFAEQILPMAGSIARALDVRLELLRVFTPHPFDLGEDAYLNAVELEEDERTDAREYLNGVAHALGSDRAQRVEAVLVDHHAVPTAICAEATGAGVTLIAMTTHGRTGLRRTVLGSVADGVLRHTGVPLLLWKPESAHGQAPWRVDHLLVPLDGSGFGEAVLPHAITLATTFAARITLLRIVGHVMAAPEVATEMPVYPLFTHSSAVTLIDERATAVAVEHAQRYLDVVAERLRRDGGLRVATRVTVEERPGHAILDAAAELSVDLVAMSTHGRGASRLVTGSTVDTVMRGREGATLLVRPATE